MDPDKIKLMLEKAKQSKQRSFEKQLNKRQSSEKFINRKVLDLIRPSNRSGSYINHFRGSPSFGKGGESDKHLDMKYQVWKELRKRGHDIIVEAIFDGYKCRPDILDITTSTIYEILSSETKEMCDKKNDYYPEMLYIIKIYANKPFNKEDLL